jgi:hypothetical protein
MIRRIIPREVVIDKLDDVIGRKFSTNISPTTRARLLYYEKDKAYYEVLEYDKWPKYNRCAGQIFYLSTKMAVTMVPLEE